MVFAIVMPPKKVGERRRKRGNAGVMEGWIN
jgi:hypothetical protein